MNLKHCVEGSSEPWHVSLLAICFTAVHPSRLSEDSSQPKNGTHGSGRPCPSPYSIRLHS